MSAGFTFARSHSGDRFYNPPAMRRLQQQQQQQQQLLLQQQKLEEEEKRKLEQEEKRKRSTSTTTKKVVELTEAATEISRRESEDSTSSKASVCSSSPPPLPPARLAADGTNLDRFLESVTPFVPAQHFSMTSMKELRILMSDFHPYFNLGDLWESFKEWSVYGAGVPLVMNEKDSVVQYYVPYLSGIQLYINPSKPPLRFRRPGEDSDAESPRDSSSEGSSDSDVDRQSKRGQEAQWNQQNQINMNRLSLEDEPVISSNGHDGERLLIFQYMEREPPFCREPLADKVFSLSSRCPELKTYNSCDLLPDSWISVAWYPIYRIPTGPTLRDLDACFLTFHSLSTQSRSSNCRPDIRPSSFGKANGTGDASVKLQLPVFGLASYKFKGLVWTPIGLHERQQANSLLQSADEWIRLLDVDHPDYSFFVSHNNVRR